MGLHQVLLHLLEHVENACASLQRILVHGSWDVEKMILGEYGVFCVKVFRIFAVIDDCSRVFNGFFDRSVLEPLVDHPRLLGL